jgi:hypothetical protein
LVYSRRGLGFGNFGFCFFELSLELFVEVVFSCELFSGVSVLFVELFVGYLEVIEGGHCVTVLTCHVECVLELVRCGDVVLQEEVGEFVGEVWTLPVLLYRS